MKVILSVVPLIFMMESGNASIEDIVFHDFISVVYYIWYIIVHVTNYPKYFSYFYIITSSSHILLRLNVPFRHLILYTSFSPYCLFHLFLCRCVSVSIQLKYMYAHSSSYHICSQTQFYSLRFVGFTFSCKDNLFIILKTSSPSEVCLWMTSDTTLIGLFLLTGIQ